MTANSFGEGILSFIVWPSYMGAVNELGDEPIFQAGYERGQIMWEVNEQGLIRGRGRIEVPPGKFHWTHIIYTHHPTVPSFTTAQKLFHPFWLPEGGFIDMFEITEDDVRVLAPDPILHD